MDCSSGSDQTSMETNLCSTERFSVSYTKLDYMRRFNQFCDVQLVVGDKKLSAHKIILASQSDYFSKLFTTTDGEPCELLPMHSLTVFEIQDKEITANSLELLIDFIYTSQITINNSNVRELLIASTFVLLNDVKEECLKFFRLIMNPNNLMEISDFANLNKINELYDIVVSYILNNFNNVIKHNSFLSFSFEFLIEVIKSDDLFAEEKEVYESVILWVKHNIESRSKYLPEFLKAIRLFQMSIDYLSDVVEQEDLIKSNAKCMNNICEAYKLKLGKRTGNYQITTMSPYKRRKSDQLILTYSWNTHKKGECKLEWFTSQNEIISTNNFTWKSSNSSIILNDGRIFCTGYSTNNNWAPSIFDGKVNQWYTKTGFKFNENIGKALLNLVELDDCIYVVTHKGHFGSYNIKNNQWKDLESINKINYGYNGLTVVNKCIYYVGHFNVLKYNPIVNKWLEITQTSHYLGKCCTICSLNEYLYVMGGEKKKNDNFKNAKRLNLSTYTWSDIPDMNVARSSAGAIAVNGLIYVIGGENCDSYEIYNPQSNTWTLSNYKLGSKKHVLTRAFILNLETNINPENISNYYSI